MTLSISLFGGLELRQDQTQKLRLPTRKSEALLAYLVDRNGDEVSREAVADLLWPLSGPDQARASLRQDLSVLRKALGEPDGERLFASSDRLAFDCAGIDVDVVQFRAAIATPTDVLASAETALQLYKAPFLEALRVRSQPFSDWVWTTRQGFERQVLEISLRALALVEQTGQTAELPKLAERILTVDSTQEAAHRALIVLFLDAGEPEQARRQFESCKAILRAKLDTVPSEETAELGLRAHDTRSATPQRPTAVQSSHLEQRKLAALSVLTNFTDAGPENYRAQSELCSAVVLDQITQKGGLVVDQSPGRVIAVFGYPTTEGRVVETTLTAAFDALDALTAERGFFGDVRTGLSYGTVLVEHISDRRQPVPRFVGPALQNAERISHTAAPGEVLIDHNVADILLHSFAVTRLPDRPGLARAHHPRAGDRNVDVDRIARSLHPMVGRDGPLGQIEAALACADRGEGGGLTVLGHPGEGKSRLLQEAADSARRSGFDVTVFRGDYVSQKSAFAPIIETLLRKTRLDPSRTADIEQALSSALSEHDDPADDLAQSLAQYFAQLRNPRLASPALSLDEARDRRSAALDYLSKHAAKASLQRPQLYIFEDAQWIDGSTAEAIIRLTEGSWQTRVCVLVSCRKDELPSALDHPLVKTINLTPLDPHSAGTLLDASLAARTIPDTARNMALAKSAGNPLMIEEYAKALCQDVDMEGDARINAPGAAREDALLTPPDILQSLLLSRIDSVPGAMQLLQYASVLGRQFRIAELSQLSHPVRVDREVLNALEQEEILFAANLSGDVSYIFKHALISDAIYSTIPQGYRSNLHARTADVLSANSDRINQAEVARHLKAAGNHDAAARQFEGAGDTSMRAAAHAEAISEYVEGLNMLRHLPLSRYRMERELILNRKAAAQHIAKKGIPTPEAAPFYHATAALGAELQNFEEIVNATWGLWSIHLMAAELDDCLTIASDLDGKLGTMASPSSQLIVPYMLGITHAYRGSADKAVACFEAVRGLHSDGMTAELQERFGMDIALTSDSFLAWVYALRGDRALANETSSRALARAQMNPTKLNTVFAHVFAATKALFQNDVDDAEDFATIALQGATEMGYGQWAAQSQLQLARVADLRGELDALPRMEDALEAYRKSNIILATPYALTWMAEAFLRRNEPSRALELLDELVEFMARTSERYFERNSNDVRDRAVLAGEVAATH